MMKSVRNTYDQYINQYRKEFCMSLAFAQDICLYLLTVTLGWVGLRRGGGDTANMLTHTYPHKPMRNVKVANSNRKIDSPP